MRAVAACSCSCSFPCSFSHPVHRCHHCPLLPSLPSPTPITGCLPQPEDEDWVPTRLAKEWREGGNQWVLATLQRREWHAQGRVQNTSQAQHSTAQHRAQHSTALPVFAHGLFFTCHAATCHCIPCSLRLCHFQQPLDSLSTQPLRSLFRLSPGLTNTPPPSLPPHHLSTPHPPPAATQSCAPPAPASAPL
jgi:hypothetical protein